MEYIEIDELFYERGCVLLAIQDKFCIHKSMYLITLQIAE